MNLLFAGLPAYAIILIVAFAIVVVVALLIFLFPVFRPVGKKQTPEEVAQDEVNSMIVKEDNSNSSLAQALQNDRDLKLINRKEKELDIIFTDEDIEALLVQVKQDRLDDASNEKNK